MASSFYWAKSDEKSIAIPALMLGADATTPDALAKGWRQFIDFETTTPEARSELEATIDDWLDERVAELPPNQPRLHRPGPLHGGKSA
ncbi:MAG: hypothetical protein ACRDPC_11355 [Solirubrobacteraceae bacterium]